MNINYILCFFVLICSTCDTDKKANKSETEAEINTTYYSIEEAKKNPLSVYDLQISCDELNSSNVILIEEFKNLKKIRLKGSSCTYAKVDSIILYLTKLKTLESFAINNSILDSVPKSIFLLENIQELDLSNNNISVIKGSFEDLKKLQKLNLKFNNITSSLDICSVNLKELDISYNTNIDINELLLCLQYSNTLQHLNLYGMELNELPNSIGSLTELQELDLQKNNLEALPDSMGNLLNLKNLFLGGNPIKNQKAMKEICNSKCSISFELLLE